ncbi:TPA: hypothetical protein SMI12_000674 [Serratia liquefaciens]|nr:hypothetical protein [Serratia liquefaciens]
MANRAYLYSLSNQPASFEDRPETISGLSEWAYDIPFLYRLLMSGNPQLCASLFNDGLNDGQDPLYAISSPFEPGFERVKRFTDIIKALNALSASAESARVESSNFKIIALLRHWLGMTNNSPLPSETKAGPVAIEQLPQWLDETVTFLESQRNEYLLLETIELDFMSENEPEALRALVEEEIERCRGVGAAFKALPADITQAARVLQSAISELQAAPLDVFFGLCFDDKCDSDSTGATKKPLGLYWDTVLYFDLYNREQFEEAKRGQN